MNEIFEFAKVLLPSAIPLLMASKKRTTNLLQIRLEPELLAKLERAAEISHIDEIEIVRAMIRTFVEQTETGEKLEFPFRLESRRANESPGKPAARGGQQTAGPMDVEAAHVRSRSSAYPPSSIQSINEDAPREIPPVIPAREKTSPPPHVTRTRAAIRKMQEREKQDLP